MAKRRGRGEGSLSQRGPNTWRLRVYTGDDPVTGRPIQASKTVKAADKRGALKALREFVSEVEDGDRPLTGPDVRMDDLFDKWLPHLERRGRAKTTLLTYQTIVNVHLRPAFGHIALSNLTPHDIDSYYLAAQQRGLADRTIRQHGFILSSALAQAVDWGWRADNPAHRAHPPERPRETPKPISPEQVNQLAEACRADIDFGTALMLGALTGARRGELCGLKWSDVDWETGTLLIERQRLPLKGGDQTVPFTKNKEARRVALGPAGMALLYAYNEALDERAEAFGITRPNDGWLISYDCGHTPIRSKTLGAMITALGKRLGMRVTTHSLRKFAATQLTGLTDVRTAAGRLGHNPEVMLRVYAGWLPERDRAAAQQLERVLGIDGSNDSNDVAFVTNVPFRASTDA